MTENAADKWMHYAAGFALLLVVSAATGLTAYLMEDVIDQIFVEQRRDMVFWIAAAVAGVFVAKGAATYGNAIILAHVGNAIVARLQRRMFDKVLAQDVAFFEGRELGDTIVRFQNGVASAREAINMLVLSIGRDLFSLISLVAVMVIQDPRMSLIVLVIGPPAVIGVMYLMRQVKKVAASEFFSIGRLVGQVKETFLGFKVVKTFTLEEHMRGEMGQSVAAVERLNNGMARVGALTVPLMETLGGVAVALAIIYGGLSVIDGGSNPGAFFSFVTALLLAYEPARRLARFNVSFQQNLIGVTMVYEILDTADAPSEREDGPPLAVSGGGIRFRNVSFAYGSEPVLSDLTFDFAPNKVTALVGPSGGGKSTIFALVNRLRLPSRGEVLIDGQDTAACAASSVRGAIAYVTQDAFLFETTIRDNIRMGRREATDEEIEAVARAAHAHDFILEQPQGYDTPVGEGGARLSGGQRQRIAIARAMLADAPILLLDEATSALDSESEQAVQEALERLMQGRTTLVIAHRLSTVRRAETIHVIDRGRCVESGDHETLIGQGGLYARLHAIQFQDTDTPRAAE
ncbi:MAG: ABC transporter ATP-binding protein [Pseudomonadota bacterium]